MSREKAPLPHTHTVYIYIYIYSTTWDPACPLTVSFPLIRHVSPSFLSPPWLSHALLGLLFFLCHLFWALVWFLCSNPCDFGECFNTQEGGVVTHDPYMPILLPNTHHGSGMSLSRSLPSSESLFSPYIVACASLWVLSSATEIHHSFAWSARITHPMSTSYYLLYAVSTTCHTVRASRLVYTHNCT